MGRIAGQTGRTIYLYIDHYGNAMSGQAIRAEIVPASDDSGDEGEAPLRPCLKSSYAAANSTGSIKVGSSASAFELLTLFDTAQSCR
jgi:hypothetical protein